MTTVPQFEPQESRWLTRGVVGIGGASLLADIGHEIPTALLPSLLTFNLGAPAFALGLIEGIADGCAGLARLAGGALADDTERRHRTALGGYTATAVLSSAIGVATAAWQVGVLRAAAWSARGLRVPARNALLADIVHPAAYGRAYGFERMMDNLGAIAGPLLALMLVAIVGTRTAIVVSVVPGLLAALAILYAIRTSGRQRSRSPAPFRIQVRPVLRGRLGRLFVGITAFEVGNVAATLLILRATQILSPAHGQDSATEIALGLYISYNVVATVASIGGGKLGDLRGNRLVLAIGVACFGISYAGFAVTGNSVPILALSFALAGVGIGFVETAENAAVAALAPVDARGSAFGLLATVQSLGNFVASAVTGLVWTTFSPRVAFAYLVVLMIVSLLSFAATGYAARDRK